MISKTEQKIIYPLSLLLSTSKKKTAEALAKTCYKSGDTMLRLLEHKSINSQELVCLAKEFFGTDFLDVILDDTLLEKKHSKFIEGSADNFDSSNRQVYRSLCSIVAMLSNGWYGLPVKHGFWIKKEVTENEYKTKVQIGKEIVEFLSQFIRIRRVIVDGLYATQEMLEWLKNKNLSYEMRFHSNRLIQLNDQAKLIKVRDHYALKLAGNRKAKTVKVLWRGLSVYITAVKRTNKKGISSIVYQISNTKLSAREHVRIYGYRWNIEIFFRTAKQSLGLTECQSRKQLSQKNHVYNVFFAYIILQFERKKKRLKNPECALRNVKRKSYNVLTSYLFSLDQIFQTFGEVNA